MKKTDSFIQHLDFYPGMQFVAAYEETKSETELAAMCSYAEQSGPQAGQMESIMLPFLVLFETRYNKKSHYGELIHWLTEYDERYQPSDGEYLMALADSLCLFDDMIYEHYHMLRVIYKKAVSRAVCELNYGQLSAEDDNPSPLDLLETAYAIVQGCSLGALMTEQYCSSAEKLLNKEACESDGSLAAYTKELFCKENQRLSEQQLHHKSDEPTCEVRNRNSDTIRNMMMEVLFVSARTAVVELREEGNYTTEEPYDIYLNDRFYGSSDRIVCSLYDLQPDTEYTVRFYKKAEEAVAVLHTKKEFVTLNVKQFGAYGDGIKDDTNAIQCAIAACPKDGRVLVPEGIYKVSCLFLKSDLRMELAEGAVLSAFTEREKFPVLPGRTESYDETGEYLLGSWEGNPLNCYAAIITGIDVSNIEITGQGTIDGNADNENWWKNPKCYTGAWRPRLLFLNHCDHVVIQGINVQNSPSWNLHPYFSNRLRFIDLKIRNPKDSPNTDGLDPESCTDVEIVGVYFSVGDDCIAIKSGKIYMGEKYKTASMNLMIRHCSMRDGHGSVTIGSEMSGGVKNLTVRECEFIHTDRGLRIKTRRGRGEQAVIDGILFENIFMDHVKTPIVINEFYFCDPDGHSTYVQSKDYYAVDERTPYIGELVFSNLKCMNCHAAGAYLYGLPEQKIRKVAMEQVEIEFAEKPLSGRPAMMDDAKEVTCLGLFARNVETLELTEVRILGEQGEKYQITDVDNVIIR